MVAVTVSFDGATRINDADANTNWANLGGGGPSPAAEAQLKYQGNNAVNRKVTATGGREGVAYDPGAGAVDMTAAANALFFAKGYVADFGDLNATYGCEVRIGSSSSDYYHYNVAGSGANRSVFSAYPAQGGYVLVAINPSISGWREGTQGTPSLTAVDYFGFAAQFINGAAKSENLAMDAIDVGRGLILENGSGGDADGTFVDFILNDQDNISNRWGVVSGVDPIVECRGLLTIGSSTETDFSDTTSIVLFLDGYHGPGDEGVLVDLSNASSVIVIGAQLIGLGSSTTSDTRPDYTVSGTSGSHTFSGVLQNFRNIVLTSVVDVDGADIQADDITQSSAEIQNSVIRTTGATAGVACIDDPTFGSSDLHDDEFIAEGSGHAIEITSPGNYSLIGLTFTGYGADDSNSAAIYNNSGGSVTLNVSGGGSTPTVRNGTSADTTVNNNVSVTFSGLQSGSEVRVYDASSGAELDGVESSGTSFTASISASTVVDYVIHSIAYETIRVEDFTWPTSTTTIPIQQRLDRNYSNP